MINEYDVLIYMYDNQDELINEKAIAEHFDITEDEAYVFFERLMMMGYAAPPLDITWKGKTEVEQFQAHLRDAGDVFGGLQPDYKIAAQAGYLYAVGALKSIEDFPHPIHMAAILIASEKTLNDLPDTEE